MRATRRGFTALAAAAIGLTMSACAAPGTPNDYAVTENFDPAAIHMIPAEHWPVQAAAPEPAARLAQTPAGSNFLSGAAQP